MDAGLIKLIEESYDKDQEIRSKKDVKYSGIKTKVMGIARMNLVLKKMRVNRDEITKIKQLAPNHKAPVGMILGGKDVINSALMQFHKTKETDAESEAFPVRSRRLSTKTL